MKRWEGRGTCNVQERKGRGEEVVEVDPGTVRPPTRRRQKSQRQKTIIAEPRDSREVRERLHLSPVSSILKKM